MKREFLQNFKVGDQPLPKEAIDEIMRENGADIEAVKEKFSDYDAVKQQLEEANRTIGEFREMDIDGVRRAAEEWKQKAEEARRDAEEKIARMQFSAATAISSKLKRRRPMRLAPGRRAFPANIPPKWPRSGRPPG